MPSLTPDPNALLPATDGPGRHPAGRLRAIAALRGTVFAGLVGLITLGLAWELWLAPLRGGTGMLALKVLPLVFGLAGVLKHRLYTFRWLSLLVWLYVTEGVMRAMSDPGLGRALAGVELALSLGLFVACAVYVRLRLKTADRPRPAPAA